MVEAFDDSLPVEIKSHDSHRVFPSLAMDPYGRRRAISKNVELVSNHAEVELSIQIAFAGAYLCNLPTPH